MPVLALLFLPKEAQFDYLVNLPDNIATAELKTQTGLPINSLGEAEAEDDGVEFAPRMKEIHEELALLHAEANRLMDDIQKTWEGLV